MSRREFPERRCQVCGTEFVPKVMTQRFCCRTCAARYRTGTQPKSCLVCGSDFRPNNRTQKYCSRACYAKGRIVLKKCAQCKTRFSGKGTGRKYCSGKCASAARVKWGRCPVCGDKFKVNYTEGGVQAGKPRKYCSSKCYYTTRIKVDNKSTCLTCGREFKGRRKYCSDACRKKSIYSTDPIVGTHMTTPEYAFDYIPADKRSLALFFDRSGDRTVDRLWVAAIVEKWGEGDRLVMSEALCAVRTKYRQMKAKEVAAVSPRSHLREHRLHCKQVAKLEAREPQTCR